MSREDASMKGDSNSGSPAKVSGNQQIRDLLSTLLASNATLTVDSPASTSSSGRRALDSPSLVVVKSATGEAVGESLSPIRVDLSPESPPGSFLNFEKYQRYLIVHYCSYRHIYCFFSISSS